MGAVSLNRCLIKAKTSGRASATELGRAAYTLLHRCVIEEGLGGIAADVGMLCFVH